MRRFSHLPAPLSPVLLCLAFQANAAPLNTIDTPQGGRIIYGAVDGAGSQAQAMSRLLRTMHDACGEKPQVGKVFRVRGTSFVAAFFSVVNHTAGNQMAGLVFAPQPASGRVEAAMVANAADRFGASLDPMLKQLFGVWHPAGAGQAPGAAAGGSVAGPAPLHPASAGDGSATVGIPAGWQAKGQGGTMMLSGPRGETVGLALTRMGTAGGRRQGMIAFPPNVNLVQAFPNIFQQFWGVNGVPISGLQLERVEPLPGLQRGVHATGHLSFGVNNPQEMNAILCIAPPNSVGTSLVMLSVAFLPPAVAAQERATVGAILASFQPNQAVIQGEIGAMAGPMLRVIHQIGQASAVRSAASSETHDLQNRTWEQGQDAQARRDQGFSNYIRDQTVVLDTANNAHGTTWNSTANALVKADPDRFQFVDTPNYWKGIDY